MLDRGFGSVEASGESGSFPTWRLIVDGEADGATNMALDEAILMDVVAGNSPPTLRFYAWSPPCLSLGRNQPLGDVDLVSCHAAGVDVVRRPTGGRAILHTDELTYSVSLLQTDPLAAWGVLESYRRLSDGLFITEVGQNHDHAVNFIALRFKKSGTLFGIAVCLDGTVRDLIFSQDNTT